MSTTFTSNSPLGVVERFLRGASQPEDAGILFCTLFGADGTMSDPHNCGGVALRHTPFTDAVCEHHGLTRKHWNRVVPLVFGERAEEEYPTCLLAYLTAYDALAGTSHLGDESNLSSDDQYLWQQDTEEES